MDLEDARQLQFTLGHGDGRLNCDLSGENTETLIKVFKELPDFPYVRQPTGRSILDGYTD